MSRCIICDYCRETDGGNREVSWDKTEKGFVCSFCADDIRKLKYNQEEFVPDIGEIPLLDSEEEYAAVPVEGLDILEKLGMGSDSS